MANTVNGQSSIFVTSTLYRESSGVQAVNYSQVGGFPIGVTNSTAIQQGMVLRARVALDADTIFTIDDPKVQPAGGVGVANDGTGQRIFVVGLTVIVPSALTVEFYSSLDGSTNTLLSQEPFAANSGKSFPIDIEHPLFSTDMGGRLRVKLSAAASVNLLVHYVIANQYVPF